MKVPKRRWLSFVWEGEGDEFQERGRKKKRRRKRFGRFGRSGRGRELQRKTPAVRLLLGRGKKKEGMTRARLGGGRKGKLFFLAGGGTEESGRLSSLGE